MTRRSSKREKPSRYVALSHWMMRTAAWRTLDCVARMAYVELAARYRGPQSNNGRLPFSVREMAGALNVSKATASRAFERLQEHGFIVETKRGTFNRKVRHSTQWRLTEFGCDETGELPTKEFTLWEKNTVSPEGPIGPRSETARSLSRNPLGSKRPSTVSPEGPIAPATVSPEVHQICVPGRERSGRAPTYEGQPLDDEPLLPPYSVLKALRWRAPSEADGSTGTNGAGWRRGSR